MIHLKFQIVCSFLILSFASGCATYKGKLKEPVTQKKEYISQAAAKEGLPQDYRAYYHYLMGLINELHNDIEPAIKEYQKARLYDPKSIAVLKNLAVVSLRKGDIISALDACEAH